MYNTHVHKLHVNYMYIIWDPTQLQCNETSYLIQNNLSKNVNKQELLF